MGIKFKSGYSRMSGCTIGNHPEYDQGFRDGQQSKQEEVNKNQLKIEELQAQRDKLHEEIAEIKQKVYDALDAFNDGYFNHCQNQLEDILK